MQILYFKNLNNYKITKNEVYLRSYEENIL